MSSNLRQFRHQDTRDERPDLLLRGLEALTIKEGDTVIIRTELTPLTAPAIESIRQQITTFYRQRGNNNVNFIVLPPNADIQTISPDDMKKIGWERMGRIVRPT